MLFPIIPKSVLSHFVVLGTDLELPAVSSPVKLPTLFGVAVQSALLERVITDAIRPVNTTVVRLEPIRRKVFEMLDQMGGGDRLQSTLVILRPRDVLSVKIQLKRCKTMVRIKFVCNHLA